MFRLFFIGWKLLGKTPFFIRLLERLVFLFFFGFSSDTKLTCLSSDDMTLAALFAGVAVGIGIGIIFRFGGTTGGVDIIARLVNKYVGWSMGKTMFIFDACVIILSLIFYLSYREAMYTLVAVFIAARVIDFMQEGAYSARGALIISEQNVEISNKILQEMDRGVTVLKGLWFVYKTGTGSPLLCCSKK